MMTPMMMKKITKKTDKIKAEPRVQPFILKFIFTL